MKSLPNNFMSCQSSYLLCIYKCILNGNRVYTVVNICLLTLREFFMQKLFMTQVNGKNLNGIDESSFQGLK